MEKAVGAAEGENVSIPGLCPDAQRRTADDISGIYIDWRRFIWSTGA
jgi:hypothetical protein